MLGGRIQARDACLDYASAVVLTTVLAQAVNLEGVACGFVVMLAPDLLLKPIDFRREELNRTSTSGTDHVMVATAIVLMLVTRNTVVKGNFTRKSTFSQKLKSAINRSKPNARVALAHELVKLLGREMLVGFKKGEQDGIALFCLLESDPFQVLMKAVLRLTERLPRYRQVIVNALLEHGSAAAKGSCQHNTTKNRALG